MFIAKDWRFATHGRWSLGCLPHLRYPTTTRWPPFSRRHFQKHFLQWKCKKHQLKYHWCLFLMLQLTISQHWFRLWLGAGQATSHYLNQWWLVYWCMYASLGLNELKPFSSDKAKVCTTYYSICYSVHMLSTLGYTIPITYATLPSKAEYITLRHRAWFMLLLHG